MGGTWLLLGFKRKPIVSHDRMRQRVEHETIANKKQVQMNKKKNQQRISLEESKKPDGKFRVSVR